MTPTIGKEKLYRKTPFDTPHKIDDRKTNKFFKKNVYLCPRIALVRAHANELITKKDNHYETKITKSTKPDKTAEAAASVVCVTPYAIRCMGARPSH